MKNTENFYRPYRTSQLRRSASSGFIIIIANEAVSLLDTDDANIDLSHSLFKNWFTDLRHCRRLIIFITIQIFCQVLGFYEFKW